MSKQAGSVTGEDLGAEDVQDTAERVATLASDGGGDAAGVVGEVAERLHAATNKAVDELRELADGLRETTGKGAHAAASAKDSVAQRTHDGVSAVSAIVGNFSLPWPPPERQRWRPSRACWHGALVHARAVSDVRAVR